MSAYLLDDISISKLVVSILWLSEAEHNFFKTKKECNALLLLIQSRKASDIFKKLYEMNSKSVEFRYGEEVEIPAEFEQNANRHKNNYQLLKSLHCFLYQCSEGSVPKSEIYKQVDKISNALSYDIVIHTKEYENAKWE